MNFKPLNYIFLLISVLLICTQVFAEPVNTKQDSAAEESSSGYRLGAGDKLHIEVFGEQDLTRDVVMGSEGKISYPFLGELTVNGLTTKELEHLIADGLRGAYLVDPIVDISILEYRPFFVNGEVSNAGSYPYLPGLTLRKAIALAGGLTEHASPENILVLRESNASKTPETIDFDGKIFPGDIITISEYKRVYINGQIKNPGSYPYQKNLTLRKLVALAGGFSERAARETGFVISEGNSANETIEKNMEDLVSPGDIVTIKQSFF